LAGRIQAHTRLTDPDQQAANPSGQDDRRVGDPNPGFEHQARQPTNRDLNPHSFVVNQNECAIDDIHLTVLKEDDGGAILDGNRPKRNVW
jgi:hypothetical protein